MRGVSGSASEIAGRIKRFGPRLGSLRRKITTKVPLCIHINIPLARGPLIFSHLAFLSCVPRFYSIELLIHTLRTPDCPKKQLLLANVDFILDAHQFHDHRLPAWGAYL